jgi:hypothetical protein
VKRPRAIAIAGIALVSACGLQDPYPIPEGQPTAEFHPAAVGEAVTGTVMFIDARPGSRVVLLEAEAIGQLEGASVVFYSSPPIVEEDGDLVIGEQLDELNGTVIEAPLSAASSDPSDTVGIVAEVTASEPGRYVLTGVRLTYRLNGNEGEGEGVDVVMTVCADDPAPTDCE